jgi:hypothetical protein
MENATDTTAVVPIEGTLTPLCVSWSGLQLLINRGMLLSDIAGAIYYLNATREQVMSGDRTYDGPELLDMHEMDPDGFEANYQLLKAAILAAELEGRVAWPSEGQSNSYSVLNDLLYRNGLPPIMSLASPELGHYDMRLFRDAIEQQGLPYTIISRMVLSRH